LTDTCGPCDTPGGGGGGGGGGTPDADGDGVSNANDDCPDTAPNTEVDDRGCACDQLDDDSDGVDNCDDLCADTPETEGPNATGCSCSQVDCDDGEACNGLEACVNGACVAGTPLDCDDGNICNGIETCDPTAGCRPGTPLECDDGNPCTDDSCDPATGCVFTPDDTNVCDDGEFCTGQDECEDGTCVPGENPCEANEICDEDERECELDSDGDGVPDDNDDCPSTPTDCEELRGNGCCSFTIVVSTPSGQRQIEARENDTVSLWIEDTAQDCIVVCPELLDCLCVNKEDECDVTPCQLKWSGDGVTPENENANPLALPIDADKSVVAQTIPNCTSTSCPDGEICCISDGTCKAAPPSGGPCGTCGSGVAPCMIFSMFGWLGFRRHSRRRRFGS